MTEHSGSCCFTGHRVIPTAHIQPLYEKLLESVEVARRNGFRDFYTGGAVGFDRLAASAVLKAKEKYGDISLHLLLPCLGQEEKWSREEQEAFHLECERADEVQYLALSYYDGCMRARNQALVDVADMCFAYVTNPRSGAGQTMRMAKEKGITVLNLADLI